MNHVALLRGINVGGNNIIKKDALKALFESVGCRSVQTYIQSGNIVFASDKKRTQLQRAIEEALHKALGNVIPVVLYTHEEYRKLLNALPKGWNQDDSKKYNALFLLEGLIGREALKLLPGKTTTGEEFVATSGALFWSAPKATYAKTLYSTQLAKSPLYKKVTIRNGNTTLKLLELLEVRV